jgi:hypothetical protein
VRRISGQELRYLVVLALVDDGCERSVSELVEVVVAAGGRLDEDAPRKQVADAIRWEIRRGRVRRTGWGRYAAGSVPRSTVWFMRRRCAELRTARERFIAEVGR